MNPILECRGLTKRYSRTSAANALDHLNLTLERGQIVGLLGPNGSGKTTLIKLINNLLVPTSGTVLIDGKQPGVKTKMCISYLPERNCLNPSMRVKDMVSYYGDFYDNFNRQRAGQMLDDLQIDERSRLKTLSKGTTEKVQLILVMSRDADLYVLDEPILTNYNENATILLSTHLIQDIENILDHVLFMRAGRLVLNSSVDEIRMEKKKSVDMMFREVFKC